jgi:hypothetical protein
VEDPLKDLKDKKELLLKMMLVIVVRIPQLKVDHKEFQKKKEMHIGEEDLLNVLLCKKI